MGKLNLIFFFFQIIIKVVLVYRILSSGINHLFGNVNFKWNVDKGYKKTEFEMFTTETGSSRRLLSSISALGYHQSGKFTACRSPDAWRSASGGSASGGSAERDGASAREEEAGGSGGNREVLVSSTSDSSSKIPHPVPEKLEETAF